MPPMTARPSRSVDRAPARPRRRRYVDVLVGLAAAVVAAKVGLELTPGASKEAIVLPLAAVGGLAVLLLAFVRFESFLLVVLAVRSSLDALKLGAASPVGVEPAGLLAVVLMLAAALWLAARRQEGERTPASPLRWGLVGLVVAAALSALTSQRVGVSALELTRMGAVLAMLLVLEPLVADPTRRRRVLVAVFAAVPVPVLLGLWQGWRGANLLAVGGFERIRGTFVHPNPFAFFLVLVLVMGVALLPHVRAARRAALVALLAGSGACLLLTYTRTAWIAAVVGLLVVGVLQSRRVLWALGVGLVVLLAAVPGVLGRFADLDQEYRASGAAANSLVWRFDYWGDTVGLARQNPLTGIGLKVTQHVTPEGKAVHNDFLRAFVETGIIGLGAYVGLLWSLVLTSRRALAAAAGGLDRGVAVGFAGCVLAFVVISVVSNVISQVVLLWYFVAFAAAAVGVSRAPDRRPA